MDSRISSRLRAEVLSARDADDRWLLVSFSYDRTGRVSYGCDSHFVDFVEHREIRAPRWRDLANARLFADVGYRWTVAGDLSMAILAKYLMHGGKPYGVTMHCCSAQRWTPELAKPSSVLNSTLGYVGEGSPLYKSLGARRPGKASRRRLMTRCYFCATTNGLTLHHLWRREMGGATEPANLLCVCRTCHDKIHRGELSDRDMLWEFSLRRVEYALSQVESYREPRLGLRG